MNEHSPTAITFETCKAIRIIFEPDGLMELICWKGTKPCVVAAPGTRLRDLKQGDIVHVQKERQVVRSVEPYR